jgi:hypothetical protein
MMMIRLRLVLLLVGLVLQWTVLAGSMLPPVQMGNVLKMTNTNVRLDYDLSTGRGNFYWQNALKVSGFYAGVGLYSNDVLTNHVTRPFTPPGPGRLAATRWKSR